MASRLGRRRGAPAWARTRGLGIHLTGRADCRASGPSSRPRAHTAHCCQKRALSGSRLCSSDESGPHRPVVRMSPVMCNGQYLHYSARLAVDDSERKPSQADLTKVGRTNHLVLMRNLNGLADSLHRRSVVPAAQSGAALFVVGDLPLVLQCRLWMQPVRHFRRA